MNTQNINGFTLLETLVVIAIISILSPVLAMSIQSLYRSHATTLSQAFLLSETAQGVKNIVADIRSASYGEDGSLPIVEIGTSTMTFYVDTDRDGVVEQVHYFLGGTTVYKGIIEPTATSSYPSSQEVVRRLVTDITNDVSATPLFRYFTATSSEITTNNQSIFVRRVEIELIGTSKYSTSTTQTRSSASIRNLKDTY